MTTTVGTPPGVTASGYRAPPPPPIPTTGLVAWFDAADASTFTFGTGSAVAEWRSKAGTTKLVQTATTYQPPRTGTLNGKPTLAFTAHALHGSPWQIATTGSESLFIVTVPRSSNSDNRYLLGCERNRGSGVVRKLRWFSTKLQMDVGASAAATTTTPALGTPVLYESLRDVPIHGNVGPWQLFLNGTLNLDMSSNYGGVSDGTQDIGGDYYDFPEYSAGNYVGDIAEIVQYNRYVTTPERQQVENYMQTKWGVV